MCNELVIIEENEKVYSSLNENLKNYEIKNSELIKSKLKVGCISKAPFNLIIIDCPIYNLNEKLIDQLDPNNGKLIYIKKIEDNLSKAYKIIKNNDFHVSEYLFDVFSNFYIDNPEDKFEF